MKYEDYKKLTPEQKEEYDWRFKDKFLFGLSGVAIFYIVIQVLTALALVIGEKYMGTQYEPQIMELFKLIFRTQNAVFIFLALDFIFIAVWNISLFFQMHKWRKSLCQPTK